MMKQRLTEAMENAYGCEAEHLWLKYPNYAVFRHPACGKWFAALMDITADKLGLPGHDPVWILDVKCDPVMLPSLLKEPGFYPAYHMSKTQWISVLLDGSVPLERILPLVEMSYDAVAPKGRKSIKT